LRKSKYSEWTKEELVKRVESLEKRKKYGLVLEQGKTKGNSKISDRIYK